jgi:serine phosphatase RsbU (regulator of sigma subunit)
MCPSLRRRSARETASSLFSDGVTDRRAPDGSMYDIERLSSAFECVGGLSPGAIVDALVAELDQFGAGRETEDDQTLLVVGFD